MSEGSMTEMTNVAKKDGEQGQPVATTRRAALAKLGLSIGVAYVAPIVMRLDRPAYAGGSRSCGHGSHNYKGFTPPGHQPECPH
jgi:hypothetical protein